MTTSTRTPLTQILNRCDREIESAKGKIEQFSSRLAENPVYAFEWSDDAFYAAAQLEIATQAQLFTQKMLAEKTPEEIVKILSDHFVTAALRGARFPKQSTSMPANLLDVQKTKVNAEWVEFFDRRF